MPLPVNRHPPPCFNFFLFHCGPVFELACHNAEAGGQPESATGTRLLRGAASVASQAAAIFCFIRTLQKAQRSVFRAKQGNCARDSTVAGERGSLVFRGPPHKPAKMGEIGPRVGPPWGLARSLLQHAGPPHAPTENPEISLKFRCGSSCRGSGNGFSQRAVSFLGGSKATPQLARPEFGARGKKTISLFHALGAAPLNRNSLAIFFPPVLLKAVAHGP